MNLLLFDDSDLASDALLRVSDHRLQHLRTVLGAVVGDEVRVGRINGDVGTGIIRHLDAGRADIEFELTAPPPPKLPLAVVLALPRPKMLRRILRASAEFGIRELHLVNSYRVEKSYWQTPALQVETVHRYFLQGLAQSMDTVPPVLHCHRRFKPFVEDELPGLVAGGTGLLAHPGPYPPCPTGLEGDTVLAVGPEGGFIPYEVDKLAEAGCRPVSLGPRILRVENALASLLGRLAVTG